MALVPLWNNNSPPFDLRKWMEQVAREVEKKQRPGCSVVYRNGRVVEVVIRE